MKSLSIGALLEEGRELLNLSVETGEEYLENKISEISLNRPGLALTGFMENFAAKRLQICGLAEFTYLKSLSSKVRRERLQSLFEQNIPGIVLARKRHSLPEMNQLAAKFKIPILRSPMITMNFINECTLLMERLMAPTSSVQGTMLEIKGVGVLIQGNPGVGKSETALSLVRRGASLVSDDVTSIRCDEDGKIIASAMPATKYHIEINGIGIIHVPSIFGVSSVRGAKTINMVIKLVDQETCDEQSSAPEDDKKCDLLGSKVPHLTLPVMPGRDMGNIVEVAVLNRKLKILGHDAAKELDEKLIKSFAEKKKRS